jgi:hypothetical protein
MCLVWRLIRLAKLLASGLFAGGKIVLEWSAPVECCLACEADRIETNIK